MKRICLHGPESTGKSWLAETLAMHFNTVFVPEFGRTYAERHHPDPWTADDLRAIVKGHDAAVAAASPAANRFLFLDTDAVMTAVWADMLLGECPEDLVHIAQPADLYLLLAVDVPFSPDQVRIFGDPGLRHDFFEKCLKALTDRRLPYVLISGTWIDRERQAVAALDTLVPHAGP
jgi:HTH-type transcriptional regulator, transcriptional repressor of NAD biosynthesis genes